MSYRSLTSEPRTQVLRGFGPFGPMAHPGARSERPLTLAVLPFVWRGRVDEDYVADALTDDLINALARLPGVSVISRSTMFTYKGQSVEVRAISRDLGVRYLLEGSLRLVGRVLRLNVQLVDGITAAEVWTECFEAPHGQRDLIEDDLVRRVARSLNLGLMHAKSRDARGGREWDAAALAARGWVELFNKPQTPQTNAAAMQLLERCTADYPSVALAWTGLSYALWRAASFGWMGESRDALFERALSAARRAIALDPHDADAYYVAGITHLWRGQLEQAAAALDTCLAINPSHAPAYGGVGQIRIFSGSPEQAANYLERAIGLGPKEPLRAVWHGHIAFAAVLLGKSSEAIEQGRLSLLANAEYPSAYLHLAAAHCRAGQFSDAREYFERFKALAPQLANVEALRDRYGRARHHRYQRLFNLYLDGLRTAGLDETPASAQ